MALRQCEEMTSPKERVLGAASMLAALHMAAHDSRAATAMPAQLRILFCYARRVGGRVGNECAQPGSARVRARGERVCVCARRTLFDKNDDDGGTENTRRGYTLTNCSARTARGRRASFRAARPSLMRTRFYTQRVLWCAHDTVHTFR